MYLEIEVEHIMAVPFRFAPNVFKNIPKMAIFDFKVPAQQNSFSILRPVFEAHLLLKSTLKSVKCEAPYCTYM